LTNRETNVLLRAGGPDKQKAEAQRYVAGVRVAQNAIIFMDRSPMVLKLKRNF
jgi:hypothetical protein